MQSELTFGMVMVLIILRLLKVQSLKVLSLIMPKLGLRIDTGTTKSEVRIKFFSKSMVRP